MFDIRGEEVSGLPGRDEGDWKSFCEKDGVGLSEHREGIPNPCGAFLGEGYILIHSIK